MPVLVFKTGPWWKIASGFLAIVALALGYLAYQHLTAERRVVKLSSVPPERAGFSGSNLPALTLDGRHLAFVAISDGKDSLWIRELDSLTAHQLPGTDGAANPFWSPDSRYVAFFAAGNL